MTTELRTSQVEVLRAVKALTAHPNRFAIGALSVGARLGVGETAAYERMRRLETRRFLASTFGNGRISFYLTQLGHEAQEGEG